MTTKTAQERITPQWLLARGWYITEAAKAIGRDPSHVRRVLIGDRKSKTIAKLLPEPYLKNNLPDNGNDDYLP